MIVLLKQSMFFKCMCETWFLIAQNNIFKQSLTDNDNQELFYLLIYAYQAAETVRKR